MLSKHRNLIAWVLLFLSSLGWYWGKVLVSPLSGGIEETTYSPATSVAVTYPTMESTIDASDPTTETWDYEMPSGVRVPNGLPFAGYLLCFLGALGAIAGVILLWQKSPLLGPDGALGLLFFLWSVSRYLPVYTGSATTYILGYTLRLTLLLGILRELLGWCFDRWDPDRCLLWRLVRHRPGPTALLLWAGWTALFAAALGRELLLLDFSVGWYIYLLLAACIGFGILPFYRYGRAVGHLRFQVSKLLEGRPIAPISGIFEKTEDALGDIQIRQQEAIHAAVIAERFKVELISNVSHDLRTPLTSILGYAELLQNQDLSPEGAEQLRLLNQKAGYMRELVDSLFELTKVSSGVVESNPAPLDLIRLLEQTIGLFDDRLTAAGLQVRRHYCADTLPLTTDGTRMHQVFANLLGNAIKYALPGTRIHLEVRQTPEAVTVRMVNTASYEMDFTPEEITQRFVRGDKARSTQGSGIGLAIAQTYTASVGGKFSVAVDGDQFSALVELPK